MQRLLSIACCICVLFINTFYAQDKITLVEVASGFAVPVGIAHTGDDRLYILEKDGYIRIMDTTGQVIPDPFLDIDARVNSIASERGLLGLAFHPEYAENGFFYVNYTNTAGHTIIARYTRDPSDPDIADPDSEMILMTVTQPYTNHNGGHLAFGPDGYLYIGLGDGGNTGDPGDRAQNGQELLGKMLRIDVDSGVPYAIPIDNPFIDTDTVLDEIWALGLRNPWRFSFDRLTADLWIADVGQNAWEEIDFQPAESNGGENYGWRCKEGLADYNTTDCPPDDDFTNPVYTYAHTTSACSGSVTGGYRYRGVQNPYLAGKYVFTDYCTGVFRALAMDEMGNVTVEELANLQNQQYASLGEDAAGELYVAAASGHIYRIADLVSAVNDQRHAAAGVRPNPASYTFSIHTEQATPLIFKVHDLQGKEVIAGQTLPATKISCAHLPEGTYIVEWISTEGFVHIDMLVLLR